MPVQDLFDQIDATLADFNVPEPAKSTAPAQLVREPAKESLRDEESSLLSWAESFTAPVDTSRDAGMAERKKREREVREFTAELPAASGSTFGRNVAKGFLNIGETGLGFFEALTDIAGAKQAKSWLKEKGDRLSELNAAIPNEIQSFTDIKDAGDASAFAAMAVGQLAPQIATALLGGVAGAAATAGRGAAAKIAGTIAGTVVPSTIQESGGIYRGVRDETGVEAPFTSLTFGAVAGALEAVTPSRFLLKVFDTGTDEIKKKAVGSLLKQTARAILKTSGTEFSTEAAQEAIALAANKFADSTYDIINSKNAVRLIDAGLMGLVGGAALGSVEPSVERAIKYIRTREEANAVKDSPSVTETVVAPDVSESIALSPKSPELISELPVAPKPPVVSPVPQGQGSFAQRAAPALDNRIRELHNLLIDSGAFGQSEFYDSTFPIPREGGIVAARSSEKYQSDPTYAAKVDTSIRDITDTMVAANRQRMSLLDKPSTGSFGVNYSIGKARATYGVNVIRAWNNEAKQTYPVGENRLGNISIRESLQNSLDAVLSAIQNREIKKGTIAIEVGPYGNKGFKVSDNGIGMSDADIGDKFLSLHSTGKAVQGRFGGFGIAKAVILGPADSATWTLRTRDNWFGNELAEANEVVQTRPFQQGTEIEVKTEKYIIDGEAKRYVETTELPKNVTVTFDGESVTNPFKGKKSIQTTVVLNPQTSYVLSWYPRAPSSDYNQQYLIRLVDPKTGSKLTQSIKPIYNSGFNGTIVVDVTTTALPGSSEYPLLSSRMGLKHPADKPIDDLVAEKAVDPITSRRQTITSRMVPAGSRLEWRETIQKTATDPGYKSLAEVIRNVWVNSGHYFGTYTSAFTPLNVLDLKIDTGFKGYHGGTMFQAKHLAAYESVSRLMAPPAGAAVTNFYGLLSKQIDGGQVNAEHAAGGRMGLNFLLIDKTSLKNPVTYALYLRDLVAHELTHDFFGPHNEEFTSKEIDVQRKTAHLFPEILRIAEAVLGKESEFGQKTAQPKTKIVERIVERRVNVPVEVQTIVEKYLSPEQLQFIYDNVEQDTPRSSKDDLYYPRQGNDQELWAQPIRTSGSDPGLSGAAENAGIGRGAQQPNPPSVPVTQPGSVGAGAVGTQPAISESPRGSISERTVNTNGQEEIQRQKGEVTPPVAGAAAQTAAVPATMTLQPVFIDEVKQLSRKAANSPMQGSTYHMLRDGGISDELAYQFEKNGMDLTLENLAVLLALDKMGIDVLPVIADSKTGGSFKNANIQADDDGRYWITVEPRKATPHTPRILSEAELANRDSMAKIQTKRLSRQQAEAKLSYLSSSIPALSQRVTQSALSTEAKTFINAFLDSKAAKYLEGARFRIAEALDGGWDGSYFKGLVEIAETADVTVGPHEFMHRVFDMLPDTDKYAISFMRDQAVADLKSQHPEDPSIDALTSGTMTTQQYLDAVNRGDAIGTYPGAYPLINDDEFFAHMMSDKFVARVKGPTGLISTIREAIKDLVAAIKKGFRLTTSADQMFRNIVNGRYDVTPEGGVASEQRRGAIVPITRQKTIERVAAFARDPAERQTEALLATGQVTSARNILDRILATVPTTIRDRVERLVGFTRMDNISTYVRDVLGTGLTEYATARAALVGEGLKNLIAVHTNRGLELFEQNAVRIRALRDSQSKKLAGSDWAAKLRELHKRKAKADTTTAAREAMQLALKNGLDRAIKRIQESGGNDAIFESAEQERKFYEALLARSGEVMMAMDSIANTLGFTPNGQSFIFGKKGNNANDLLAFYHQMVPLPVANPVTGRNPQFAINRVAAEILARNVDLRQRMVTALWTEQAALKQPIATFEDKIVHDMQAGNPRTVVGKLIKQAGNLSNNEGKAAAAFLSKYREVTREVEKLEALEEAVRVIDDTLADPQYRALRTEVAADAKAEIRPQGAKALEVAEPFYAISHIYLPDGTIVQVNMFPDKVQFETELKTKLDPALTAINNWLHDPPNLNSPEHPFYQQQYDTFHDLWWSHMSLNSPKQLVIFRNTVFKVLDSMLGMLDPMLQSIGTRSVGLAQTAGQIWKDANHQMGNWLAKWNPLIVDSLARAAKSHPNIWEGQARGNATEEWHKAVFSPLAASIQDPARPGYKVGDVIPESGETVTQQDWDAVQLQSSATAASFLIDLVKGREGIALPNVVEDRFVPGLKFLRKPMAFAKNMIMRRFGRDGMDIATAFAKLKEGGQPSNAALEKFWNDHFEKVKSAVVNRNAQYSNLTQFEDVLAASKPHIANGSISNVSELVDFIFNSTVETKDDITAWLFGELDRHATAISKATAKREDLGLLDFSNVENQNPFTVGRGGEVAPPAWYSYGFSDSPSIYNFSMSGSNFYFEILIKALKAVSADMGKEISRLGTEELRLAQTMSTGKAAQTILRQNQDDIRLGRQTFDLETATDMKRGLDKLTLKLNERYSPGGRRLEEEFGMANKAWGLVTSGVLASAYTLTRNALEGGFIQNGFRMSRLFGSTLQGFPRAFLGLMQTLLKVGGSGLWSVPVATIKLHPIAGARTLLTTGNFLKAEQSMFGDAMREIATNLYERIQMFRDLEDAGLGMPAYPSEQVQASIQYPLTFGQVVHEKGVAESPFMRIMQSIGPAALTFYDAQMNLFIRPVFSRAGDQIANIAVANTTLGAVHNLEARLRKLFSVYRAAGVPIASLSAHTFTPSEILGKWFGIERTQTSLREIQLWFNKSLIPFNESVFDYLTRLEADPKAQWLTHEQKMRLVTTNVEAVNVATPLNRPELFKRNQPMRMIGALLGWNVNTLRNAMTQFTGVSASDPNFSRVQLRLATYTMFLATLAYSALGQAGIEEILRFLSQTLFGEERATRQPWEQEGGDQAKQWALYAFSSIPFVATAANMAFNDLPNKASFSPTLLAQAKVIDVMNYVAGAIRTRDITYRLPQTIRGLIPLAPVVLNRLPGTEGTVEAMNSTRLYRRYGDSDQIRKPTGGPGASATATRLTSYGDRILNALARGDYDEAEAIKAQAVQVATQLGKADPERSVEQMIVTRLPHRRAFKSTLNATQMGRVLGKMSQGERAQVAQLNDRLKTGLGRLGINTDFVEQPRATDFQPRFASGIRPLRVSRSRIRRSRLVGLSSGGRSRRRSRLGARTRRRQRRLSAMV